MVSNSAALSRTRLGRADVEPAIELRGIARDHFAVELFGEPNAQRRFSRSRGTDDGNEWRMLIFQAHRKRRWRARTNRKMSTNSARRMLPKICCRAGLNSSCPPANYSNT